MDSFAWSHSMFSFFPNKQRCVERLVYKGGQGPPQHNSLRPILQLPHLHFPSIKTLIRDSYAAMADYPDISAQLLAASNVTDASWKKASEIAIGKKLTEDTFGCAYDSLNNLFWVAEEEGGLVLGCVGLERAKPTDSQADVVRMAVSRDERGGGVGGKLIAHLAEHAKYRMEGVETLHLTTANPRAANFYHKHQFERIFPSLTKALPIAHPVTELIHEMVRRF